MSTFDKVLVNVSLSPAARTDGTASGVAVDRGVNGGMQDAVVVVTTGTITDGSHAITVEDSNNGSSNWAAVAAEQIQGTQPTIVAANDDTVFEFGVRSTRRHLRVVAVTTGATTGGIFGAVIALGLPRVTPVTRS